jgi:hypothetical protein
MTTAVVRRRGRRQDDKTILHQSDVATLAPPGDAAWATARCCTASQACRCAVRQRFADDFDASGDGDSASVSISARATDRVREWAAAVALDGVLDRTLCLTTHKVGIVYVGPGQSALDVALHNLAGSSRYNALLHQLGHFERLVDGEPTRHRYTGGLDRTGGDGEHALFWSDQLSLIVYHVCTLMPNRDGDAACTNKLRHIGNDYVNIVFSANDEPFNASQFRGQFNFVTVIIYPKRLGMYRVDVVQRSLQMRAAMVTSSAVVSKHALVPLLRATVIAADEAAAELVDGHRRRQANAEVRLLQIKSMAEKQKRN